MLLPALTLSFALLGGAPAPPLDASPAHQAEATPVPGIAPRIARRRVGPERKGRLTPEVETALERGVKWIARQRRDDGAFGAEGEDRVAETGMALLALVGAGCSSTKREHRERIAGAVIWIANRQDRRTGCISANLDAAGGDGHALCLLALAELYLLDRTKFLKARCRLAFKGLDRHLAWDSLSPEAAAWSVLALHVARASHILEASEIERLAPELFDVLTSAWAKGAGSERADLVVMLAATHGLFDGHGSRPASLWSERLAEMLRDPDAPDPTAVGRSFAALASVVAGDAGDEPGALGARVSSHTEQLLAAIQQGTEVSDTPREASLRAVSLALRTLEAPILYAPPATR